MSHFVTAVIVPPDIPTGFTTQKVWYGDQVTGTPELDTYLTLALDKFDENKSVERWVSKEDTIAASRERIKTYEQGTYAEYLKDPEAYRERAFRNPDHIRYVSEEFPKRIEMTDEELYQEAVAQEEPEDVRASDGAIRHLYNPDSKWDWWVIGGRWSDVYAEHQGETLTKFLEAAQNKDERVPFAIIYPQDPDFVWIEKGSMGWWGMVADEVGDDRWRQMIIEHLGEYDGTHKVVYLDLHI